MKFVQNPDWGILKDVAVTLGSSKSSAFEVRQKHRIPEGNRKQTKEYPEGIPEGLSDSDNYMVDPTFWKASWIPKKYQCLSGSKTEGIRKPYWR